MAKRTTLRLLALCLIAFAVLGVFFLSGKSFAQEQRRKFNPGEMVETGGGIRAKILQCRGTGDNEECDVQYYRGDTLESTPRWENADSLRRAEERVIDYERRQAANQPESGDMNRAKAKPAEASKAKENETNEQVTDCSFAAPAGDSSKTAKPSELLFKQKIYERHNAFANGTGSAPLKVGIRFLSFQVGKPFTNTVRVDPARGALRINDAAPVNATIYPVKSEHIVCDQYRDGTQRKRVENKYACFKNRDGEWVCGPDGIPKITQLN